MHNTSSALAAKKDGKEGGKTANAESSKPKGEEEEKSTPKMITIPSLRVKDEVVTACEIALGTTHHYAFVLVCFAWLQSILEYVGYRF